MPVTAAKCKLTIYEDRDRSGYTFEQREQYQQLRKRLMNGEISILIVKDFSRFSRRNSKGLVELEMAIKKESTEVKENENTFAILENQLVDAKNELKAVKKRKIKEIAKADEDTVDIIEETYAEIEEELVNRIKGLQNQINLSVDKRNDIIRVNRLAKTAIDIFNYISDKKSLDKRDLELIIDKIIIYEDRIH